MNIKHNVTTAEDGTSSEGHFNGECESSSNDNMTVPSSAHGFNDEINSSRSNSVSSDVVACDIISSNDDDDDDNDDYDDEDDVRVD